MVEVLKSTSFYKYMEVVDVNMLLLLSLLLIGAVLLFYNSRLKRISSFIKFNKRKNKKKKERKKEKSYLDNFKEKIEMLLLVKGKVKYANIVLLGYIVCLFSLFIMLLSLNSLILAISLPIMIHFFTAKIIDEMIVGFDVIVRKNFTMLINQIVKVFSATNDLGIVLYESSKKMEEPLRGLILTLSREIITDNSEQKLINFVEKTDNLWLHSFIFTLVNYKENSSKEDVIDNLTELANMIEERNKISEKMINDRKPIIILNYMLLAVGIVLFLGNLTFNPFMKDFLFSPAGTICLLGGVGAMFGTVLINTKLVKY